MCTTRWRPCQLDLFYIRVFSTDRTPFKSSTATVRGCQIYTSALNARLPREGPTLQATAAEKCAWRTRARVKADKKSRDGEEQKMCCGEGWKTKLAQRQELPAELGADKPVLSLSRNEAATASLLCPVFILARAFTRRHGCVLLGSRLSGWFLRCREMLSYAGEAAVGVISRGLRDRGGGIGLLGQGGSAEVLRKGKVTDKHGPIKGRRRC